MFSSRTAKINPLAVAGVAAVAVIDLAATKLDLLPPLAGLAIFAVVGLFSCRKPDTALIFVVFVSILIPVDMTFAGGGAVRIGPTRFVMAAFAVGWLMRLLPGRRLRPARLEAPLVALVALYLLCGVLSTMFSVDRQVSVNAIVGRDLLEQFFLFYLFVCYLKRPGFFRRLQTTVFIATGIVCMLGLMEFATLSNPLLPHFPQAQSEFREGILRTRSVFFHPIALACYINLVFPFVVVRITKARRVMPAVPLLLLALLMVINSILTVSRAPWVCLFMECMIMTLWWGTRSLRSAAVAVTLLLLTCTGVVVAYQSSGSVARLFDPVFHASTQEDKSSEYYRIILAETVMERLKGGRWVYGYGPNAFYLSGLEAKWDKVQHTLTSADNHYLKLLLEYGALGLSSFILLVLSAAFACFRSIRKAREGDALLAVAGFASAVGFIAVNATASMFQMYPLGMLFWMSVAVALSVPRTATPSDAPDCAFIPGGDRC